MVYFKGFIDFLQFPLCLFLPFFKGIFHFFFKGLNHLHKVILRPFLFVSRVLDCSGLADVGSLIFGDAIFFFVLLNVFLHCCLPISSSRRLSWSLNLCGSLFLQLVQVNLPFRFSLFLYVQLCLYPPCVVGAYGSGGYWCFPSRHR